MRESLGKSASRTIGWFITVPYTVCFVAILVLFHPPQVLASFFSRRAQKRVLDLMNLAIIWNIRLLTGARFRYVGSPTLPEGRSVIIVSNHQSMYDIPMIMWACRSREIGFIAKKELGRWIPSISFALRTLDSCLIDRKDAKSAIRAIAAFGEMKESKKQVASVFPEGTRARDGVMKDFRPSGFNTLMKTMPSALIQPVAIRGNWELLRYHFWPVPFGTSIEVEFLEPIEPSTYPSELLLEEVQKRVKSSVGSG